MNPFDVFDAAVRLLEPLGVPVNPKDSPARMIRVSITPGTVGNRRRSAAAVDRVHVLTVMCVGRTEEEAAWLAYYVTEYLDGARTGSPDGTFIDTSFDGDPLPETTTAPKSWSKTLTFQWTTKRRRNEREK